MPDTFAVTVAFIAAAALVAAVLKRIRRDKCLRDFHRFMVTMEETGGKTVWGRMKVGTTGLEFVYPETHKDPDGHDETSYLVYKNEYAGIQILVRYHDQLSEPEKQSRAKDLKRTYHPSFLQRLKRKIQNVFKTVRDAVMDVLNVLLSHVKKASPAGAVLGSQDKYVSQMKQELIGSAGTAYEPLLERYIGRKVVLDVLRGDKIVEYCGVLKNYTADFVEVMDVRYQVGQSRPAQMADLVVPRKYGIVRHLAE